MSPASLYKGQGLRVDTVQMDLEVPAEVFQVAQAERDWGMVVS